MRKVGATCDFLPSPLRHYAYHAEDLTTLKLLEKYLKSLKIGTCTAHIITQRKERRACAVFEAVRLHARFAVVPGVDRPIGRHDSVAHVP